MTRDRIERWGDGRDDLVTMTPEGDGANGPAGAPCADLPVRMAGTHSLSGDRRAGISALACLLGHVCAPLRDGVDHGGRRMINKQLPGGSAGDAVSLLQATLAGQWL